MQTINDQITTKKLAARSYKGRRWQQQPRPDQEQCRRLARELLRPLWQIELLHQRQLHNAGQINDFIHPSLHNLPSPFEFKAMRPAARLIREMAAKGRPLVIVGDYDVDGVTSAALLGRFLKHLSPRIFRCHPDRFKDGYGLKARLVTDCCPDCQGLVITVDCGISDSREVESLKESGWQVIITDHHQPPPRLPEADVIINPWLTGCSFPFKELAGVGVAFYLAMGIRNLLVAEGFWSKAEAPNLKDMLDLVAVGTVADMVELKGPNRILVKAGMEISGHKQNTGLRNLMAVSAARNKPLDAEYISFQLAPRLNAAGRMNHAELASELLATDDDAEAAQMARSLDLENSRRKELTSLISDQALEMASSDKSRCLLIHGRDWHEGLIGIVASRVVEHFARPVIVMAGEGQLRGSARSIPGLNIYELLNRCGDLLTTFGGHAAAAGMSLAENKLPAFKERLEVETKEMMSELDCQPVQPLDLYINQDMDLKELLNFNELLQPFGQGNPEPIFFTDCALRNIRLIGKDKNHLRFEASFNHKWYKGIGFGLNNRAAQHLSNGHNQCAIAFNLRYNQFRGQRNIELQLLDFLMPEAE
ncbi:MAG TPA: single-stranded-DNA-specific exonuclease RecJ [Desulfobacterales bacterium]|nr:single-stranded-DNA-specific exonuclease RecJ [Desulfobacterales bacterium]